jgi:hypothetical protein
MQLRLDAIVQPVNVEPGGTIVLRGSYTSTHDGSVLDAATTQWPDGAPGGASVDAGGLVDLAAGGFHMTSRDPATHEVRAVATGELGSACQAAGVASPCLVLRHGPLARSRLLTMSDWAASLKGGIAVEVVGAPAYAPAVGLLEEPAVQGTLGLAGLLAVGALAWTIRRRRRRTPAGKLDAALARVRAKLKGADAALAASLGPAVERVADVLGDRRVDAASREGARIADVLRRVEARIDESKVQARAAAEQEAADELVAELEGAIEAADEAMAVAGRR